MPRLPFQVLFWLFGLVHLLSSSILPLVPDDSNHKTILSTANNEFSIKLYNALINDQTTNMVVSPFSVATLLSMVLLGSEGLTLSELNTTLGYQQLNAPEIAIAYKETLTSVQSSLDCELSIANSIWVRENFPVSETFKEKLATFFEAEERDFNQTNGLSEINQWVSNKTKHKISKLLDEVPETVMMLLINAIYFKGPWKVPFDPQHNVQRMFRHNDGNDKTETTFMRITATFPYAESSQLKAKILELPYTDTNLTMVFLLPFNNYTLSDVEQALNSPTALGHLQSTIESTASKMVNVTLPKFSISTDFDMVPKLQALGIQQVFTTGANLAYINPNLKIDKVFQKANVDVNEKGGELSGATAFLFSLRSLNTRPKQFNANHPFMFLLCHKPTSTILFLGRYSNV